MTDIVRLADTAGTVMAMVVIARKVATMGAMNTAVAVDVMQEVVSQVVMDRVMNTPDIPRKNE